VSFLKAGLARLRIKRSEGESKVLKELKIEGVHLKLTPSLGSF
jgi:hypothetical protein